MRLFDCPGCGSTLWFGNTACACGLEVVWEPGPGVFAPLSQAPGCANRAGIGCNWAAGEGGLCRACAMTQVIPDTFQGDNRALWAEAESAKRRVLAGLARWGWFTAQDPGPLPVFHLLAEATATGAARVVMGHDAGLVTINVTEADPAERVERREELGERLRTMTGHFRHELAHFLFERLTVRPGFLDEFRALMGDERADYGAALEAHYTAGPPPDWQARHVTAYASAHPHEDWAESAAHLMHLTEIADSAAAAGLRSAALTDTRYDGYAERDAEALIALGMELGIAFNHVNRAMGLQDLYPFVLTPAIRAKLALVHRWLRPD